MTEPRDPDDQVSKLHDRRPNVQAALTAYRRGYMPVPIRDNEKRPFGNRWHVKPDDWSENVIRGRFAAATENGAHGVGLACGEQSNGLIDVDLDHPLALATSRAVLTPPTPMMTGRAGKPMSHYWYKVTGSIPPTRKYLMPDGSCIVELRSTRAQTVIPPTTHPSGEAYRWEGEEWADPSEIDGRLLALKVANIAVLSVLREKWPSRGGRHDAYLALAGGMLRYGRDGVHPYWNNQKLGITPFEILLRNLAEITHDEEAGSRIGEVLGTTLARIEQGEPAVGFPTLAEMIGADHAERARRFVREMENLAGFRPEDYDTVEITPEEPIETESPVEYNPILTREDTWEPVSYTHLTLPTILRV